jgi:hypothetical protein
MVVRRRRSASSAEGWYCRASGLAMSIMTAFQGSASPGAGGVPCLLVHLASLSRCNQFERFDQVIDDTPPVLHRSRFLCRDARMLGYDADFFPHLTSFLISKADLLTVAPHLFRKLAHRLGNRPLLLRSATLLLRNVAARFCIRAPSLCACLLSGRVPATGFPHSAVRLSVLGPRFRTALNVLRGQRLASVLASSDHKGAVARSDCNAQLQTAMTWTLSTSMRTSPGGQALGSFSR